MLALLEDLAENHKEKYATFWKEFGRVFKEGVGEDYANRERIAKLLRFASTHTDSDEQTSRSPTMSRRMKDGQDKIYYVTADSVRGREEQPASRGLPQEGHRSAADVRPRRRMGGRHICTEFEGKPLQSVAKGGLDLGKLEDEAEKEEQEKEAGESKPLLERIKKALGERSRMCASRCG